MSPYLSPAELFDELASSYEEMRKEIEWDPFVHLEAAFNLERVASMDFLDLGCGTGEVSRFLQAKSARPIGVDISLEMCLLAASKSTNLQFLPLDISEALPFEDASFDAVVALGCLEYVEDIDSLMREITRVLRPGGRFLGVFERYGDDCPDGQERVVQFFDHWRRFRQNEAEIEELAKQFFSHSQIDRVRGYLLEESGRYIQYLRLIADL